MSDSVRPHRRQPTSFPRPWSSPIKNAGVGCHFLLQCMKVKSESEVAQSYLTLHNPVDCSLPGSSIHGIFQAIELFPIELKFLWNHKRSYVTILRGKKKNKFGGITLFQSHRNQNSMVLPEKQIRTSVGQN